MNALLFSSESAYGSPALRSPRDMEYNALSRVTRMLTLAPRRCIGSDTVKAVSKNIEIWTLFASDLAHDDNQLEDSAKAGLLSLAIFCLKHGHDVLQGKADTDILIDVNISVMKGLRGDNGK